MLPFWCDMHTTIFTVPIKCAFLPRHRMSWGLAKSYKNIASVLLNIYALFYSVFIIYTHRVRKCALSLYLYWNILYIGVL